MVLTIVSRCGAEGIIILDAEGESRFSVVSMESWPNSVSMPVDTTVHEKQLLDLCL
jgi:hypothetical protein